MPVAKHPMPKLTGSKMGTRLIAATRTARWEQTIVNAVRKALDKHRAHAIAALDHLPRKRPLAASVTPDLFGADSWGDDVGNDIEPDVIGVYAEIHGTVARMFNMAPGELPEINVGNRLGQTMQYIQHLGTRAASELGASLNEGVYAGESMEKLAARVDSVMDQIASSAMTIARTEVIGATNGLSMEYGHAVNAAGQPLEKVWLSTLDERTRGNKDSDEFDHVSADGETVPIGDPFTATGEELDYPGDPNGSPGNIINCRCTPVFQPLGEDDAGGGINALDTSNDEGGGDG